MVSIDFVSQEEAAYWFRGATTIHQHAAPGACTTYVLDRLGCNVLLVEDAFSGRCVSIRHRLWALAMVSVGWLSSANDGGGLGEH
jgi:hypothetical protein